MSKVIDLLSQLNSKERFFLLGYALGNNSFNPSSQMRDDIYTSLNLILPGSVFATMDFHLDWLFAAMKLASEDRDKVIFPIEADCITATLEDIDFMIAYDIDDICHIILLEAKGVTGWTNSQMNSKAKRLGKIFGADGKRWKGVVPHFAIISPRPPQRLAISDWPIWMAPNESVSWIELPGTEGHHRIHRCDQNGKETKDGGHWTIARR